MNSFTLEIRTPETSLFHGRATSLTVTASDGELGILPGHAALATILAGGSINYQLENGEKCRQTGRDGFLIFQNNQASILLKS